MKCIGSRCFPCWPIPRLSRSALSPDWLWGRSIPDGMSSRRSVPRGNSSAQVLFGAADPSLTSPSTYLHGAEGRAAKERQRHLSQAQYLGETARSSPKPWGGAPGSPFSPHPLAIPWARRGQTVKDCGLHFHFQRFHSPNNLPLPPGRQKRKRQSNCTTHFKRGQTAEFLNLSGDCPGS